MPDDLRQSIIAAIAESGDENFKKLLLLLLRVEEVFIAEVSAMRQELTVPVAQHTDDHQWISATRKLEGGMKSAAGKIIIELVKNGALVAAGAIAAKLVGG